MMHFLPNQQITQFEHRHRQQHIHSQKIIDELETEQRALRDKYEALKRVLMARNKQIQFLEADRNLLAKNANKQ